MIRSGILNPAGQAYGLLPLIVAGDRRAVPRGSVPRGRWGDVTESDGGRVGRVVAKGPGRFTPPWGTPSLTNDKTDDRDAMLIGRLVSEYSARRLLGSQ